MLCSAYFGAICESRRQNWEMGEDNPYKVLEDAIRLERKGHDLLSNGSRYFHDQIQVDWGSFAWKCTPEEVLRFLEDYKIDLEWLIEKEEEIIERVKQYIAERENAEFGVVFIEEG